MDNEILEKIGLTKGESRAYIAMLKIGKSSVGNITKEAKISRSKIYDVLGRLSDKGLMGSVSEGKQKKFIAVPPERLNDFIEAEREELKKKSEILSEIIPILNTASKNEETHAEILYGPRGIKAFFDMSLYNNKEMCYVLGYSYEASAYFNAYFRDFHKKRLERKIPGKVIYDYETWFRYKREKRQYVEQRYLPKGFNTPAFIYIFGDTVGTILFSKSQKLCFMIRNKEVAESYKKYFMMLWNMAIKTGV